MKITKVLRLPDRLEIVSTVRGYVSWPRGKEYDWKHSLPLPGDDIQWGKNQARWTPHRLNGKGTSKTLRVINVHWLAFLLALLAIGASIKPPASTGFTASWNGSAGAQGYMVIVQYGTNIVREVDAGTNLQVSIAVPGGFDYSVVVEGYVQRQDYHHLSRGYGLPCPAVTVIPNMPDNSPQMLVIPPNWFVMCAATNGGFLLSSTNLGNWVTNGSIPSNAPALHQGAIGNGQFFRSVTH